MNHYLYEIALTKVSSTLFIHTTANRIYTQRRPTFNLQTKHMTFIGSAVLIACAVWSYVTKSRHAPCHISFCAAGLNDMLVQIVSVCLIVFLSFVSQKEKDLELTARIGKELLTHNNKLEASVNSLEAELKAAKDEITQLAHDVIKKTELIQVGAYTFKQ